MMEEVMCGSVLRAVNMSLSFSMDCVHIVVGQGSVHRRMCLGSS